MTPRHLILAVLGAAVLVAGVYLYLEVRSTPNAVAQPAPVVREPAGVPQVAAEEHHDRPRSANRFTPEGVHNVATGAPSLQGQGGSDEETSDETAAQLDRPNPKIDAIMDQANKHYDKGEWEDAKVIAAKVLTKQPTNIRMMRIMVSASCVDGDSVVAQKWFDQLPKPDREQMKVRCDKYGVSFKEPAQ